MPTRKRTTSRSSRQSGAGSPAALRLLRLEQFVRLFKDSVLGQQDVRYCFVLGSGASVTSGVPTGAKLVDQWLTEMHRDARPGAPAAELSTWTVERFAETKGFRWEDRASFYGPIYLRRFPDNASGQAWLRRLMDQKHPSFGYSVLARILSQTQHNVVVTTNFDNLVRDALEALACPNPFIAHSHEDARFLANHEGRVRILKLHGDIDRETYNASSLIDELHRDWWEPLRHLLGSYTPVFLGYGGCDPGFMSFLNNEYAAVDARPRPVWTYRVNVDALKLAADPAADPPGRPDTGYCRDFMERQQAWWLPTPGFDELMLLLGHALGFPHGGREIRAAAERVAEAYQGSLTNALKAARGHDGSRWCPPLDEMTRQAEQALLGEVKLRRWIEWREYINASVNPTEEISRCREAIAELPDDPRPYAWLALALAKVNPRDPQVDTAFAASKERLAGRFPPDGPEALSIRNVQANVLYVQGRYAEAEAENRQVLALREAVLGPEDEQTLASRNNLANSLQAQGKHGEAEAQHRAVLEVMARVLGPEHPDTVTSRNNLGAALLGQEKAAEAEREFRSALAARERELGVDHLETLRCRANLASALDAQGKHAAAELEFRTILGIMERVLSPEHPDLLTMSESLATCLEQQGKNDEAIRLARRTATGRERSLGAAHPDTQSALRLVQRLEQAR